MVIAVGDIVIPSEQGIYLRSGAETWSAAVVCSVKPFVMVSEDTTMRWGQQDARNYTSVGKASPEILEACMKRL